MPGFPRCYGNALALPCWFARVQYPGVAKILGLIVAGKQAGLDQEGTCYARGQASQPLKHIRLLASFPARSGRRLSRYGSEHTLPSLSAVRGAPHLSSGNASDCFVQSNIFHRKLIAAQKFANLEYSADAVAELNSCRIRQIISPGP